MSKARVLWEPNSEAQRAFLACSARVALIQGGAGSGKTSALLAAAARQCANPKSRAIIFRRDYPSLRQIIDKSYQLFVPLRAAYNKSEHVWRFPGGGTVEFGHLDDQLAMWQYAGQEFSFLGFDELTQLPGDAVDSRGQPVSAAFQFLPTRLRKEKDSDLHLMIRCTATPGGPGMGWVKSYFRISDSGESGEFVHPVTGFRIAHFKAATADNPALDADYHRQFLDQPEARRQALLNGSWTAFEGQIFSEWNYQRHTCKAIDPAKIPASWDIWRGADDGFAAPMAVYWLTYNPIDDRIIVLAEIYAKGLQPEEAARAILKIDETFERDEPITGIIDSASFANIGLGGETGKGSRGHIMNHMGCGWKPSEKGAGSRVAGVHALHQRLALAPDGYGKLMICRNCVHLIRTLPMMTADRNNPEDIDPNCEEHGIKGLIYGISRRKIQFSKMRIVGI